MNTPAAGEAIWELWMKLDFFFKREHVYVIFRALYFWNSRSTCTAFPPTTTQTAPTQSLFWRYKWQDITRKHTFHWEFTARQCSKLPKQKGWIPAKHIFFCLYLHHLQSDFSRILFSPWIYVSYRWIFWINARRNELWRLRKAFSCSAANNMYIAVQQFLSIGYLINCLIKSRDGASWKNHQIIKL